MTKLFDFIFIVSFLGIVYWLLLQLPIPQPFSGLIKIAVIVGCILLAFGLFYGGVSIPRIRW
jgi:hypothetical protein